MKEYKKTYWPLIVWCLALLPVMLGAARLAEAAGADGCGMIALMMAAVVLMLILLMWIIQLGGYVYWINGGPSFEEAKAAGEDMRRTYAQRHLKVFVKSGLAAMLLIAILWACGAHEIVIMLLAAACIIAAAIRTVGIKWPEEEKNGSEN